MTTLANFPMKDQRTEKTTDGNPPENASYDCVPTSFAAAIQYFDGGYVAGDELKDAEYGQTYANAGTALRRYIDDPTDIARLRYGVTASPYNNTDTTKLTAQIHTWIQQGFPVIATIPSAWGTAHDMPTLASSPFSTHVICFYSESSGNLTAMNPWGGFAHSGTDAYWQGRLCDGQVWKVFKETSVATTPTTPTTTVPAGWKDDGTTLVAPNGVAVVHGFRTYVLEHAWNKDNYPLIPEFATTSVEPGNASIGAGSRQDFRWSSLGWTQAKNVYGIWTGQDIVELRKELAAAQAEIATLKSAPVQVVPPTVKTALAEAANLLAPYAAASSHVNDALKGL